jgi:prepilin-type N-terminal cleavage/methylation domain-containing protein
MKIPLLRGRDGFTLIEILIVVCIIGILVGVAMPAFLKSRTQARKQVCIDTLAQIESAKQLWGVETGKKNGDIPREEDLIGPNLYIKIKPTCPGAGVYNYGSIGVNATCSLEGHSL